MEWWWDGIDDTVIKVMKLFQDINSIHEIENLKITKWVYVLVELSSAILNIALTK